MYFELGGNTLMTVGASTIKMGLGGNDFFVINANTAIFKHSGGTIAGRILATTVDLQLLDASANPVVRVNTNGVGLNGVAGVAPPTYTVANPTTDRALDVTGDTLAQGLAVLGTLIADLKLLGALV